MLRVRDPQFPMTEMEDHIAAAVGSGRADFLPATRLATALMGDSIATNLFLVGYAYQKGLIPLHADSIMQAIEMNGAAVEMNKGAFQWGRRAALDLAAVDAVAEPPEELPSSRRLSATLDEAIGRRVAELTAYQNRAYARRYEMMVERARAAEASAAPGRTDLTDAVARNYFKLLAYKDEFEVARLFTETGFLERLKETFEGDYRVVFHLAPPLWTKRDRETGDVRKQAYGPWMLRVFRLLAALRRLRSTPLDPFRATADRRLHRRLLAEYERVLEEVLGNLSANNYADALALAALPDAIRGYGHIRERHAEQAKRHEEELLDAFRHSRAPPSPGKSGQVDAGSRVVMAG